MARILKLCCISAGILVFFGAITASYLETGEFHSVAVFYIGPKTIQLASFISALVLAATLYCLYRIPPMAVYEHVVSAAEVRKRYSEYILLRLLSELKDIDERHGNDKPKSIDAWMENSALVHDEIQQAIDKFRYDCKTLLSPSQSQVLLPIEQVLCIDAEEEQAIRSRFKNIRIRVDDDVLRSLANP